MRAADGIMREEAGGTEYSGSDSMRKRDLNQIPVGLPFTEMVQKAKNFNVTRLHDETASVRQTVMQPTQARASPACVCAHRYACFHSHTEWPPCRVCCDTAHHVPVHAVTQPACFCSVASRVESLFDHDAQRR